MVRRDTAWKHDRDGLDMELIQIGILSFLFWSLFYAFIPALFLEQHP
jgi:hypothetical protein